MLCPEESSILEEAAEFFCGLKGKNTPWPDMTFFPNLSPPFLWYFALIWKTLDY